MSTFVTKLTEKELREEHARLAKLMREGEATLDDANRLAEVKAALKRIQAVRSGKIW